ncbi:hypothetical protein ANANG_G00024710 [Anguilla anguilla]|uniref:Uncharacterized protein n=1 Tax=Anguilla anguilla TaxID=7936 RepID=A0A9D3S7R8_ANGAN|nr:hypothetical protein ANANG_G00024710 [Anguilla anguilla]
MTSPQVVGEGAGLCRPPPCPLPFSHPLQSPPRVLSPHCPIRPQHSTSAPSHDGPAPRSVSAPSAGRLRLHRKNGAVPLGLCVSVCSLWLHWDGQADRRTDGKLDAHGAGDGVRGRVRWVESFLGLRPPPCPDVLRVPPSQRNPSRCSLCVPGSDPAPRCSGCVWTPSVHSESRRPRRRSSG